MNKGNPTREFTSPFLYASTRIPLCITSGQAGFTLLCAYGYFYEHIDGTWELEWWIDMGQTDGGTHPTSSFTIQGINPYIPYAGKIYRIDCYNNGGTVPNAYIDANSLVSIFHIVSVGFAMTHGRITLATKPTFYVGI